MTDHLTMQGENRRAGTHLLADLYGCRDLDNAELIVNTLRDAALASGATILHHHIHQFQANGGLSGAVILAESHITIHTWPEIAFAAVDIFLCGRCNPDDALPIILAAFAPQKKILKKIHRGRLAPQLVI